MNIDAKSGGGKASQTILRSKKMQVDEAFMVLNCEKDDSQEKIEEASASP